MNTQSDEILEGLRPRMQTARVAHVRRMIAGLAMVPLIGFGAIAMAADADEEPSIETADAPDGGEPAAPDVVLPSIGDAEGDDAPKPAVDHESEGDTDSDEAVESEPIEETKVLSLGPLGEAEIVEYEGYLELLDTDLEPGWEVIEIEITDDGIVIVIKKGDSIKIITITPGVRGEIDVDVTDFFFPTTTEPPPPTTEKPKEEEPNNEEPPIVDRFVVEVPGKGSFVVEREGETLWVGNVEANEGFDYHIEKGEGWKVWVKFTNGEWNWFAKAFINDDGQVEQHFWDEEVPFEGVFQWVEVPEVGAVQFKLWSDGLVYVKAWETAEGIGFYDYNEGSPAEVAKIDFEGEGVLWIVEAWGNDDDGLSWSVTDATVS